MTDVGPVPTRRPAGAYAGLVWNDDTRVRIERILNANPKAGMANVAAHFKVSVPTMRRFFEENPDAMDCLEIGRAAGDNAISAKNFALALKGDSKALDREMKKRGMIGNDLLPQMQPEKRRDYSKLTVEELEFLAKLDDKITVRPSPEGALREIAPPLHS